MILILILALAYGFATEWGPMARPALRQVSEFFAAHSLETFSWTLIVAAVLLVAAPLVIFGLAMISSRCPECQRRAIVYHGRFQGVCLWTCRACQRRFASSGLTSSPDPIADAEFQALKHGDGPKLDDSELLPEEAEVPGVTGVLLKHHRRLRRPEQWLKLLPARRRGIQCPGPDPKRETGLDEWESGQEDNRVGRLQGMLDRQRQRKAVGDRETTD